MLDLQIASAASIAMPYYYLMLKQKNGGGRQICLEKEQGCINKYKESINQWTKTWSECLLQILNLS